MDSNHSTEVFGSITEIVCAWEGGANTIPNFPAAHFVKRNTKFGGGGKARAGKNSFPPTPFLFARPSVQFGARSAPSVPFKIGSDFVKQTHTWNKKL